jgi:hypothetical protein
MVMEHAGKLVAATVAGVVGAAIGWSAQALTLSGRVDAIEASQARIEAMMHRLIEAKAAEPSK